MNKNKTKILLAVTLMTGCLGFYLQLWLWKTGVDSHGLLIPGHPAGTVLLILTALEMLLLYLYVFRQPQETPAPQLAVSSPIEAAGYAVAAAGIVYAGFAVSTGNLLGTLVAVVSPMAALALGYLAWCSFTGRRSSYLLYGLVAVFMMLFLACQYQDWSRQTQLLAYLFPLLGSVFILLGCYYRASLCALSRRTRELDFVTLGALFFCCLSIRGPYWAWYLAMALWMAADLFLLSVQREVLHPMPLPRPVATCLFLLQEAGFEAYVVGGCVRDHLLKLTPHDYDMCTNATPQEIRQVFAKFPLVCNGEKHGTIGVVMDSQVYEITTFRTEGGYADSRHPDWVEFVDRVDADLARRDFTVNAIAYAPTLGYLDPFQGQLDLENRVLRAVGDPTARFTEDPLRILRGVRFAVRYDLQPEAATAEAMDALAPQMEKLARERVYAELNRLLPLVTAEDLLRFRTVLTQVIPELAPTVDFDQKNPHHQYDLYTHIAQVTGSVPDRPAVRWAALLHDIGKPGTFTVDEDGTGHFLGHAQAGAQMADEVLRRLKAPTRLREQVVCLIGQHMNPLTADRHLLLRRLSKLGEETLRDLLALQKADLGGKGTETDGDVYADVEALLELLLQEQTCLSIRDLAVDGNDLMAIGFEAGPRLGACLEHLLLQVQQEVLPNEKAALLEAAGAYRLDD